MAKLDYYFSVFNCHLNNAHDQALEVLERENPAWATEMRDWKKRGIMAIFDQKPTPVTKRYVELVIEFVNENREDD